GVFGYDLLSGRRSRSALAAPGAGRRIDSVVLGKTSSRRLLLLMAQVALENAGYRSPIAAFEAIQDCFVFECGEAPMFRGHRGYEARAANPLVDRRIDGRQRGVVGGFDDQLVDR